MPPRARTSRRRSAVAAAPDVASPDPASLWDVAVRLLAGRDRSEYELRLRFAEAAPEVVDELVGRLRHFGYLDDTRFAAGVSERLARRGFGSERVRRELAEHRIAYDCIESVVAEIAAGDRERAVAALRRRYPEWTTLAERGRAARFLAGRGYPETVIEDLVGDLR